MIAMLDLDVDLSLVALFNRSPLVRFDCTRRMASAPLGTS